MTSTTQIPNYVAGTWSIDPVHSTIGFTARHMMVSKVRGNFRVFSGTVTTAADPMQASVTATIDLTSVDTASAQRDEHVRSADFFEVEKHREMTFRSTGLRAHGNGFVLDGDLTLKGVTKSVPLTLELEGIGPDAFGGTRAGFSAKGEINRKDFDVNFNAALETGGVVVSDKITIELDIEAVLDAPASGS